MIYTEKNDDWNFRYTNIKKKVETWTIFGAAISAEIKQELENTIFTHYLLITQSLLLSFYLLSNIQSVILLLVTYSYLNWTHKRLLITYSLLKSRSFIFTHYFDHYLRRSNITYYEHPCLTSVCVPTSENCAVSIPRRKTAYRTFSNCQRGPNSGGDVFEVVVEK